jgi:hypothetical protein
LQNTAAKAAIVMTNAYSLPDRPRTSISFISKYLLVQHGASVKTYSLIAIAAVALATLAAIGSAFLPQYDGAAVAVADTNVKESAVADEVEGRAVIQARVDELAKDGCQAKAFEIRALHMKKPIVALGDLPKPLRDDIALCYDRGVMHAHVRGYLADAGLDGVLRPKLQ